MTPKTLFCLTSFLLCLFTAKAQSSRIKNVIVVTTDGFRWQELFGGMDSAIANNPAFNQGEKEQIYAAYWDEDEATRRKKLFPFIWGEFVSKGQLYGNRKYRNFVNITNPYSFSYPGYNELFTGFADSAINTNQYPDNPNLNVFEFINRQPGYRGRVAAFGSWEAYRRILRKKQSGFPVIAAFDTIDWKNTSYTEQVINRMKQQSYKPEGEEGCMDVFTHFQAMEYLRTHQPRLLYIALLETDEWAHRKMYKNYLDAAHQLDSWLQELWQFVQQSPVYKNNTAILITTDHGRGDINKLQWTGHGGIKGADEIWLGIIGPGISAKGEVKTPVQLYQKQVAQTIASLLNLQFVANHPVAEAISEIW